MALSEASLKKLSKEEVINLALDYRSKFDSIFPGIRNELSEPKQDFGKLGSELVVNKLVNEILKLKKS